MRAVVLAGGKGTRLRPLTESRPKPLVEFLGEPYALGLLRRLRAVDVDDVTFLIAQDPGPYRVLEDPARELGVRVRAITEEVPLDTAGAARRLLRNATDGAVLVCNGDVLTDLDLGTLVARHDDAGALVTIALTRVEDTSSFGVVVCDDAGRVERFVEKPAPGTIPHDTVNAGTYVLSSGAFDGFPGDGPLSFERDVFPGLVAGGAVVVGHADEAYWQDLGTPARYLEGQRAVLGGHCRWPLADGMGRAGERSLVAADAALDESARVGPDAVIGRRCRIDAGAELRSCALHVGVTVGAGARVEGAIVGPGARIAAGAVVTAGTVVADDATYPAS